MRIAIAQINPTVGDLKANSAKIIDFVEKAKAKDADLVCFPELSITGYPPEDLLLKEEFIKDNLSALNDIVKNIGDIICVVGFVDKRGKDIFNAAACIHKKKLVGVYHKMLLPNYGVFDERRYFAEGENAKIFNVDGIKFGINICEDIWHKQGPLKKQAKAGAKLIININASPYHTGKTKTREKIVINQAKENRVFIVYNNLVGGQDELVFDGQSMVVNDKGRVIARSGSFREDLLIVDLDKIKPIVEKVLGQTAEVYEALKLGLRDYVHKNGFKKIVIGLSGGIDSALTLIVAADALGPDNCKAIIMPSKYSSGQSKKDAQELADNLDVETIEIPIDNIFSIYLDELNNIFKDKEQDVTEENLQARIRGNILMALSNKFGWLVLTTGNKSEVSTGYCTIYGDTAGGFSVLKDVPKTLVYKLAKYRNAENNTIPQSIIDKAPTAELRPNQKDQDSLPAYDLLDAILKEYIENDKSYKDIVKKGFSARVVTKVINLVEGSEYKRRQSAPGIKITPKAFGKDRRIPITNKYKK